MQELDEDMIRHIVNLMIQNYGDLLKVSRSRGVYLTLPNLRKVVAESYEIQEQYQQLLSDEILGQGLSEDALLKSLQLAQAKALAEGESKNNTQYAEEIKKIIAAGKTNRVAGEVLEIEDHVAEKSMVDAILNTPLDVEIDKLSDKDCKEVRAILLNDFEKFSMWCFELQMGFKFQRQDFHSEIFTACNKIISGEYDRIIVTIPPRHSKTQIFSIFLPLFSFCHNPGSHNIITSYGDDIVQESSGYIRAIMLDQLFMKVFHNVRIDRDKRSLERWGTTRSGVMHAVATGGKMTGKGAGSLAEGYSGVFVCDDTLKPKDAYSDTMRSEINDRYDNTFMSRLANDGTRQLDDGTYVKCPRTPMVIIMQRLHEDDLVGYLLRGNSADRYHWLNIPAIIEDGVGSLEWYNKIIDKQGYTHAIPILFDLKRKEPRSALWPSRKSLETLDAMKEATPYTFNSQYMGDPSGKGVGVVDEEWYEEYDELDKKIIKKTFMTADTASTTKSYSDYSVVCLWGVCKDNNLYLIDVLLGKWETPELIKKMVEFWKKHTKFDLRYPKMLPKALYMEDKSSGQYINQQFVRDGQIRCLPVPRDKSAGDKFARFLNTVPYFAQGRIRFPRGHEHSAHIKREVLAMSSLGNATGHDDVCDNVSDGVTIAFSGTSANYESWL